MLWRVFRIGVLGAMCGAAVVYGRLGDSEKELVERFGPVEMRGKDLTSFEGRTYEVGQTLFIHSGQWLISAVIIDGRCARISYSKTGTWTEEQVAAVFDANGSSANWKADRPEAAVTVRKWKRNDGATAGWSLSGLQLTHPAYDRRLAVLKAQAIAESHRRPKF